MLSVKPLLISRTIITSSQGNKKKTLRSVGSQGTNLFSGRMDYYLISLQAHCSGFVLVAFAAVLSLV